MKNLLRLPLLICTLALLPIVQGPLIAQPSAAPAAPPQSAPHPDVAALLEEADKAGQADNVEDSLRLFNEALAKARTLGDKAGEAITLHNIGLVYHGMEQPQQALRFYEQSLPLTKQVGDKAGEAVTLNNIGQVYDRIGQSQKALLLFEQALPLCRQVGNKAGEATTLNNIGLVYERIGQPQQALKFFEQALLLRRQVGDKPGEAATLNNIGSVYKSTGQMQQALGFYEQALPLHRQVGDKAGEAVTLNNIGTIYRGMGQLQQALRFYEQALPLRRQVGDKSGESVTLSNIGTVYMSIGQMQQALKFFEQSLPLTRQVGDKAGEATTLNNIGVVYRSTGQMQQALRFYRQVLPLLRQIGYKAGEATTLSNIGALYMSIEQAPQAIHFYEQALSLHRQVGDKAAEAGTLSNISKVEEAQGRLTQADKHLRAALIIYEDMRQGLGGSSQNKITFLQSQLGSYQAYINLLLKQKSPVSAFAWAQKTKARALLDLMGSGKVNISRGLSQAEREQERALKGRVAQANQQLLKAAMQPNPDKAQVNTLKAKLEQAGDELQHFTNSLYARHSDLSFKRAAHTATLSDVATFLPADTALLEYVVLRTSKLNKVVLFCVTLEKDKSGKAKAVLQAYPINRTAEQLGERVEDFRIACSDPNRDYQEKAAELYKLLVAPAARQLQGRKRLVICPDGPLWGTPFQALMMPGKAPGQPDNKPQFLIKGYEVSYAYSATGAQAALAVGRKSRRKPGGTLLAFANPNFIGWGQGRDSAVSGGAASNGAATAQRPLILKLRSLGASSIMRGDGSIQPLPGTQLEADAIKGSFPDAAVFTGDKAQEAVAKQQVGNYRFLHFATHGVLSEESPLESGIVLATAPLAPTAQGAPEQEDGLLQARELFDLNLNAEMVVLSACDSGRGQKQSGEGVVGLSWALFVAGAPTQVLSQWAVEDASTAQLMKSFYANLKAGRAKGASLRGASLSLMKDGEHAHPFYWAPFVLIGDWR